MSAAASLMAGTVLFHFGWTLVLLSSLPALMLIFLALIRQRRHLAAQAERSSRQVGSLECLRVRFERHVCMALYRLDGTVTRWQMRHVSAS